MEKFQELPEYTRALNAIEKDAKCMNVFDTRRQELHTIAKRYANWLRKYKRMVCEYTGESGWIAGHIVEE